jgi:hypothetical protein
METTRILKTLVAALAGLTTSLAVCAEPAVGSAARAGVASAVQRYANAIACPGVNVMPADVMMLSAGYEGAFAARYAVLWVGDMRCLGGAGSGQVQLAIATFNNGQYVVQPELSSPVVAFESPVRVVTRIVSHNARNLVLEGKEFGPEDPPNTPSVPVRFILRVDGTGNWKLVDKVFLHTGE